MNIAISILVAVAVCAWGVAVVSSLLMLGYRAPGVSLGYLMTHGMAFFDDSKFTAGAAPHRRRLGIAFVVFFLSLLLIMPLSIMANR